VIVDAYIRFGRNLKAAFFKARLDVFFKPFVDILLKLAWLSKLSYWCSQHNALDYTDADAPNFRYDKRYELYQFILESQKLEAELDYLEFGVGKGYSFQWWLEHNRHPHSRFWGFDTFTGLPEGWGKMKIGTFSTEGEIPAIADDRAQFAKGLFQETLPAFLSGYKRKDRLVVHMDADLYSSTLFVLTNLATLFRPGDLLIFDEFAVPTHEFRAFSDFVSAFGVKYEVLGAVNRHLQVAMRIAG